MRSIKTSLRSRAFSRVATVSCLWFLVSCNGPAKSGAAQAMSATQVPPDAAIPELVVTHQVKIKVQAKRVEKMEATVEAMRRQLIEERFKTLDKEARRRRWARRAPRESSRYYARYREWKYLVENKEKIKAPKRELVVRAKALATVQEKPVIVAKPESAPAPKAAPKPVSRFDRVKYKMKPKPVVKYQIKLKPRSLKKKKPKPRVKISLKKPVKKPAAKKDYAPDWVAF